MTIIFFVILAAVSLLGMILIILASGRGADHLSSSDRSVSQFLESSISITAYGSIALVRRTIRYFFIRFLIIARAFTSFGRAILTRVEKRFSLLIDAIRGRGQAPNSRQRGSVSFFLEQIKDYKEEMARRANIRS